MPWVTVNLMEGHTKEQKRELFEKVTKAVSTSLDLPEDYVRIQLVEMSEENHAIAGKAREEE